MKSKLPAVVVVVLVVLGLVGWKAGLFKPAQTADAMVRGLFSNVTKVQTSTYALDLTAKVYKNTTDAGTEVLSAHIDGSKKQGATIDDSVSSALFNMKVSDPSSSETITVGGELRAIGKIMYLKVTDLPPVPMIDTKTIINQWFSIDIVKLAKDFGDAAMATKLETALNEAQGSVNTQMLSDIGDLYTAHPFVLNAHFNGTKKVGDVNARLVAFDVDKTKLADFFFALAQYMAKKDGEDVSAIKESDISEGMNAIDFKDLMVGVDSATGLPALASGVVRITDQNDGTITELGMNMEWKNFNQPVTVEAPTGSQSIEKLLAPIFMMSMMQAQQKAAAAQ